VNGAKSFFKKARNTHLVFSLMKASGMLALEAEQPRYAHNDRNDQKEANKRDHLICNLCAASAAICAATSPGT
jgi:hypothetical protein